MDKNLYSLLVQEKGRVFNYYCLLTNVSLPTYSWMLVREDEVLCMGLVEHEDISLMLDSLYTDLNAQTTWKKQTLH